MMLFNDLILLSETTDIFCTSVMLQNMLRFMIGEYIAEKDQKLMWILFISSATAHGTEPASLYKGHFAEAVATLKIKNLTESERVLVGFLWSL